MPLQGVTLPALTEVKHPYLIVQNFERTDSIYHIYDLRNNALTGVFGVEGRGPGEYMGITMLAPIPSSDIPVFDVNTNSIYWYGISEEGLPVPKGTTQAWYKDYMFDIAFMSDSLFVINPLSSATTEVMSLADSLPRKTRLYRNPDIDNPDLDPDLGYVYANESRIAQIYAYKKQIDFMDIDLNLIKKIAFEYKSPINLESEDPDDIKRSYASAYFGKRYLYVMFWGTTKNERVAKSYGGASLEVFDLDGNPVAKYHLDGMGPDCFSVDEETFTLYGAIYYEGPEDSVLMYKLKGLL